LYWEIKDGFPEKQIKKGPEGKKAALSQASRSLLVDH